YSCRAPPEADRPCPHDRKIHQQFAIEGYILRSPTGLENTVEQRRDQSGVAIEQPCANHIKTGHRGQCPNQGDYVEHLPIVLSRHLEHRGICPEEEWRLAFDRVEIWSTAVNNFVGHDRVHCFTVDWLWM